MLLLLLALLSDPAFAGKRADNKVIARIEALETSAAGQAEVQASYAALLQDYNPRSPTQRDAVEGALRRAATSLHQAAIDREAKESSPANFSSAEALYRLYLTEFPDTPQAYEMHYAFGELLYKQKKFDEAYFEYMTVANLDPRGQHTQFCVESAIFAAEKMQKSERPPPGALSVWDQRALSAMELYAQLFPEDPKTQRVLYRAAYLYYNRDMPSEAAARFTQVIAMNPGTKEAEQAANLTLDGLMVSGDLRGLRDAALAFSQMDGLGSPAFQAEIHDIYVAASCKIGEPLDGASCPGP